MKHLGHWLVILGLAVLLTGCSSCNTPQEADTSGSTAPTTTVFFENFDNPIASCEGFTGWIDSDGVADQGASDYVNLVEECDRDFALLYVLQGQNGAYVYRPFTGIADSNFSASFDFEPGPMNSRDWVPAPTTKIAFVFGFGGQVRAGVLYDTNVDQMYTLNGTDLITPGPAVPGWTLPAYTGSAELQNFHLEYNHAANTFTVKCNNNASSALGSTTAPCPVAGYTGFFFAAVAVANNDWGHLSLDNVRLNQPVQAPSPAVTPWPTQIP